MIPDQTTDLSENKCTFCGREDKLFSSDPNDHCCWVGNLAEEFKDCRSFSCYETELSKLKQNMKKAIKVINGYEKMRQNCMSAISLAIIHGMVWPEDQINLANDTINEAQEFLNDEVVCEDTRRRFHYGYCSSGKCLVCPLNPENKKDNQ